MSAKGLSPRVRGSPGARALLGGAPGSIPACAGEPNASIDSASMTRVYPRVCGGAAISRTGIHSMTGLSPRVRGSHDLEQVRGLLPGSIPACAGEPSPRGSSRRTAGVYPRVCGGAATPTPPMKPRRGLSPRVRGSRLRAGVPLERGGSIPACAGEPPASARPPASGGVYPRVCGGALAAAKEAGILTGLSPRVRGSRLRTQERRAGHLRRRGSIPACAGEPPTGCRPASSGGVYPRVCGGACRSTMALPPA